MKSILMSIKPKHCANILNGLKTIEIRKRFPKGYRGWIYVYCTKDNHQLVKPKDYDKYLLFTQGALKSEKEKSLNGKVIARFYCDDVKETTPCKSLLFIDETPRKNYYFMGNECQSTICLYACLSMKDLDDYLQGKNGYAIHISQLEIFDTPKELSEFAQYGYEWFIPVEKAPQNYMYIEAEE